MDNLSQVTLNKGEYMISCDQHDYIEIVCLYKYPVRLTLRSGAEIEGRALDTQYNDNREHCIKIQTDEVESLVCLDLIRVMAVLADNPHLQRIVFD